MNKPRTQKATLFALQVENWNLKHPVGTAVMLQKDSGDVIRTTTRSEAYICDSGYPVIFLTKVSGYYLLDRVSAVRKMESEGLEAGK